MKTIFKLYLIVLIAHCSFQFVLCQSPSFQTYTNPVIPGDHPDATLTRVGNDFYTTGSSFNLTPAIYHSTDLVHWETIAQPVSAAWTGFGDSPGGGCWGGHMVYYKLKYWHFFSRAGSMYFVTAVNPAGPWSQPVKVNNPVNLPYSLGYDNSIFIDDDGKWYLVVKNGQPNNGIVELGDDGQPTGVIYNLNWLNPGPSYPYSWAEGPVIWKSFGFYYYSFARDLSGGQKVMRSPVLTAEQSSWEMLGDFFNQGDPLKSTALFTEPNHCSPAIMLDDSTFWVIHPLYAKTEWKGQGRQGLLNQVVYDANYRPVADYPVNKAFNAPELPGSGIPWMVPKSDFFASGNLHPEWRFLGYTPASLISLTEKPGWLRLSSKTGKKNILSKNDGEHNYSIITRVEFNAGSTNQEAGLIILRGDESQYVKLFCTINSSGEKVVAYTFGSARYDSLFTSDDKAWLMLNRVNHYITGYFSHDGIHWKQVGNSVDISSIDAYSDFSSFTGTRQGLYVLNQKAYFDLYIYRDAYTSILAGWPANQYGTSQVNAGTLDNIHNNDWALYAGVEFGNREYGKAADSIHIVASSVTGGDVEIWLDSIDTGNLIGTCTISPTGGLSIFKTFRAKVARVIGRHDVYLRFVGSTGKLFMIKWVRFVGTHSPHFVSSYTENDSTILVKVDKKISLLQPPYGLTVFVNDTLVGHHDQVTIDQADSTMIHIILDKKLSYDDIITVSYDSGSIYSHDGMELFAFEKRITGNQIPDPSPRLLSAKTTMGGDSIIIQFNKKMRSPDDQIHYFSLYRNSIESTSIQSLTLDESDSSIFVFMVQPRSFFEDTLNLTYSGDSIRSKDGFPLKQFTLLPLENYATGYPPRLTSGHIQRNDTAWNSIVLKFDRLLADVGSQTEFFNVKINNQFVAINALMGSADSIVIEFFPGAVYGDIATISYSGGNIKSIYHGILAEFSDYQVQNNIPMPVGNETILPESSVIIHPVPIRNEFYIEWLQAFELLEIYNTEGGLVFNKLFPPGTRSALLTANLPGGTYILVLSNKGTSCTLKIMVVH